MLPAEGDIMTARIFWMVAVLSIAVAVSIGGQAPQGRGGRGGATLPSTPVAVPIPTYKAVSGPGAVFPGLQKLPPDEDLDHFKYIVKEYFISGTAQGLPYTTRVLVRRPFDVKKFSGIVAAEPMHSSGNSWMFHFTHMYVMSQGDISLEILVGTAQLLQQANMERYKELALTASQTNEILAQVGALIKKNPKDGPLEGLPLRKMTLMGTSQSAGTVTAYLPAHVVYRLADMKPIYDGFLPTSQGANPLPKVDVPVILMPTMTEVNAAAGRGNPYRRPDGDSPGDQFRIYEVAGMAHNDSRINPTYNPDPCKYPVSRFPQSAGMSIGLDHLIQWVDKGRIPPRAPYIATDGLDEFGNVKGGVRNTYVDVPTMRYIAPNEGAAPPISNPSAMVAGRGAGGAGFYCGIAGYQLPLSNEQLRKLYKNKKDYQAKVEKRLNELIKEGWFLPVYKNLVLADASRAEIP
jgi:hypothetical protein